jgi:octaprenyl-diphosphate synthase
MNLIDIRYLVSDDRKKSDELIIQQLHSQVALIEQIGHYIVESGGKRLRPLMALLSAKACHYQGNEHHNLAAIIEFIHTATLLHDDVVDESTLRRGRETANAIWGDHSSVLVGDFLYSRAFQMMVALNNMEIMGVLADTTNIISEGEVLQLLNARDPETTEERYFKVIECKTGKLFAAATRLGAIIAHQSPPIKDALEKYGLYLGIAYQLIDDVMDYTSDANTMGKNVGDDLAEGKPTLPLIYILKHGTTEQKTFVRQAIETGTLDNLSAIQQALAETGAIDYTAQQAHHYANLAKEQLDNLENSDYKTALLALATLVVERDK